ncbi:FAD/NAD(P)-binding protein [Hyphomicrobium sp. 99]|uniref:FAD/NAD(P)-binding protein n=1 Tax=Hyphomicrobium sp. 99 TaxID=1163419 RepID=UPI001FD88086|nr:FAD-dependent oxidoreductase [Hyphomicrobium sp. 99]
MTVAIVGGGFSGASVAYHLALRRIPVRIVVFEPRPTLGSGLAYGDSDPHHRINVPAHKMSLLPDDEAHFRRWIDQSHATAGDLEATGSDGNLYPNRSVFGSYMEQQLRPLIARGAIEHIRERVSSVAKDGEGWLVRGQGADVYADIVVVATTHPPPRVPAVIARALKGDPRLIPDATAADALAGIDAGARVLIVGTGLTMADVVATLDAQGHRGEVIAISRRGLRSRGHSANPADPFGNFSDPLPKTARDLLRRVRTAIADADLEGVTWHSVIDSVRAHAKVFWPALPLQERRRIVRHLRPYWDVHRFRVAPQPEAIIVRRIADGSLTIVAASVDQVRSGPENLEVVLRLRRSGKRVVQAVDHIITTTGPAHDEVLSSQPYLAGLKAAGHLREDPTHLGIACDAAGHALNSDDGPNQSLFIAGPLARGTIGELMGLPQVSEFSVVVANGVANQVTRLRGATAASASDIRELTADR